MAKTFAQLFAGFTKKHGRFDLSKPNGTTKRGGRAYRAFGTPTDEDFNNHFEASGPGIGIVMLHDDGETVSFGAIDVDVYDLDHVLLEEDCAELPLTVVKSKSGGAHLYLFVEEPVSAELVQRRLSEWAAALGYGGCEIFPKQTRRTDENDMGNWINLPYYGGERRALLKKKEISLDKFVALANQRLVTAEYLEQVSVTMGEDFVDGPPCLQIMTDQGQGSGSRNVVLANVAVYLKQKYPETWEDQLVTYNHDKFDEPLPNSEVQAIIKSYGRSDYFFQCSTAPLLTYCNKRECLRRKFGVGSSSEDIPVIVDSLTKVNTSPPIWYINLNGVRVKLEDTDDFSTQPKFRRLCIEVAHKVVDKMPEKKWNSFIQDLLDSVEEIDAPDDASEKGQWVHYVEQWIESHGQHESRDRLVSGNAWLDEKYVYFRSPDLLEHFRKTISRSVTPNALWDFLRNDLDAKKGQFNVKGRCVQWWRIDLNNVSLQQEGHDTPSMEVSVE
tara:strand:+ start:2763 stop:4259 length:1497 start_codon:yes stop_codon:yes gene_type:complete